MGERKTDTGSNTDVAGLDSDRQTDELRSWLDSSLKAVGVAGALFASGLAVTAGYDYVQYGDAGLVYDSENTPKYDCPNIDEDALGSYLNGITAQRAMEHFDDVNFKPLPENFFRYLNAAEDVSQVIDVAGSYVEQFGMTVSADTLDDPGLADRLEERHEVYRPITLGEAKLAVANLSLFLATMPEGAIDLADYDDVKIVNGDGYDDPRDLRLPNRSLIIDVKQATRHHIAWQLFRGIDQATCGYAANDDTEFAALNPDNIEYSDEAGSAQEWADVSDIGPDLQSPTFDKAAIFAGLTEGNLILPGDEGESSPLALKQRALLQRIEREAPGTAYYFTLLAYANRNLLPRQNIQGPFTEERDTHDGYEMTVGTLDPNAVDVFPVQGPDGMRLVGMERGFPQLFIGVQGNDAYPQTDSYESDMHSGYYRRPNVYNRAARAVLAFTNGQEEFSNISRDMIDDLREGDELVVRGWVNTQHLELGQGVGRQYFEDGHYEPFVYQYHNWAEDDFYRAGFSVELVPRTTQ